MLIATLIALLAVDIPDSVNIAKQREQGRPRQFQWSAWSDETFASAKRENRFILLDCAAEWCHWCHVMDETTYLDPDIAKILNDRFVAIKVDIDERPDLAERYGAWGWPATVIFSPDAEELGKFRGYLSPDELKTALNMERASRLSAPKDPPIPVEALGWLGVRVAMDMDEWYDPVEGSWGRRQKAPLGANVEFELRRAAHGDSNALQRAEFSLKKQRALIDPVWGGVYQYSAAGNWNEPHFEKLMPYQSANLEAYARAGKGFLEDARRIDSYIANFLTASNGAFYATQDADLNAHEKDKTFVDGHTYYALDDAGRRKLGIPRIDTNLYPRENGLAIAALCTLYEATNDEAVLKRARRAADAILAANVVGNGDVRRKKTGPLYLADAAAFGWSLTRLGGEYRDQARLIGEATVKNFFDEATGGCWEHTPDPNAVGVFTRRQQPFIHNVVCARFFAGLGWRDRAQRVLAAIATPRNLNDQGRMVGDFLLALDESGRYLW